MTEIFISSPNYYILKEWKCLLDFCALPKGLKRDPTYHTTWVWGGESAQAKEAVLCKTMRVDRPDYRQGWRWWSHCVLSEVLLLCSHNYLCSTTISHACIPELSSILSPALGQSWSSLPLPYRAASPGGYLTGNVIYKGSSFPLRAGGD